MRSNVTGMRILAWFEGAHLVMGGPTRKSGPAPQAAAANSAQTVATAAASTSTRLADILSSPLSCSAALGLGAADGLG